MREGSVEREPSAHGVAQQHRSTLPRGERRAGVGDEPLERPHRVALSHHDRRNGGRGKRARSSGEERAEVLRVARKTVERDELVDARMGGGTAARQWLGRAGRERIGEAWP